MEGVTHPARRPHQNSAPTMIAQPIRNSPMPSRRRAGSTLAPSGPTPRAALPITCAVPVQALITAPDHLERRTPGAVHVTRCCRAAGSEPSEADASGLALRRTGRGGLLLPADRDLGSGRRAPEPDRGRGVGKTRGLMRARPPRTSGRTGRHTPVTVGRGRVEAGFAASHAAPSTSTPGSGSGSPTRPTTDQPSGTPAGSPKVAASGPLHRSAPARTGRCRWPPPRPGVARRSRRRSGQD